MRLPSFRDLQLHATRTLRRFPIEIFVATLGTIAAVLAALEIYPLKEVGSLEPWRSNARIILACIILLSTSLSLTITRESQRISWWMQIGIFVAAAVAATFYMMWFSFTPWENLQLAVVITAVHLLVALSAIWNRDRTEFWEVNKVLFLRTLMAGLFTQVLGGGLSLALFALQELFGVDVDFKWYGTMWAVLVGLFNTWFVLGGIPETPTQKEQRSVPLYPRGLRVFVQYVLLPLVLVFLCILYAYGVKVLFFTQLNGSVAAFIDALAVVGTLSFLLLYPLRNDTEHAWINFYASWFGRLMIPLCVLLWIALVVRVQAYGVTEERYLGLVVASVLTVLSLYLAIARDPDLRIIPVTLLLACIVCLSGPIGMLDVAYGNQTQRAERVLRAGGVLHDGMYDIAKAQKLSDSDKLTVQSTLDYLSTYRSNNRLNAWLASINADSMPDRDSVKIDVYMGVWTKVKTNEKYAGFSIGDYSRSERINIAMQMPGAMVTPFNLNWSLSDSDTTLIDQQGTWVLEVLGMNGTKWRLQDPSGISDTLDLAPFLAKDESSDTSRFSMNLQSVRFPRQNVALVLTKLSGSLSNGTWEDVNANGVLVTTPK